jgi:hypothetical protein
MEYGDGGTMLNTTYERHGLLAIRQLRFGGES